MNLPFPSSAASPESADVQPCIFGPACKGGGTHSDDAEADRRSVALIAFQRAAFSTSGYASSLSSLALTGALNLTSYQSLMCSEGCERKTSFCKMYALALLIHIR